MRLLADALAILYFALGGVVRTLCDHVLFVPTETLFDAVGVTRAIRRWPRTFSLLASGALIWLARVLARDPRLPATSLFLLGIGMYVALGLFRRAALWLCVESYFECTTVDDIRAKFNATILGRWATLRTRHELDAIWFGLVVAFAVVTIPPTVALFLDLSRLVTWPWYLVAAQVVALRSLHEPFMHNNVHYNLFKPKKGVGGRDRALFHAFRLANEYPLSILAMRVPKFYAASHLIIHHAENNGPGDFETTMPYDRSSWSSCARFYFGEMFEYALAPRVALYLARHRHKKALRSVAGGMAIYYAVLAVLLWVNAPAALFWYGTSVALIGWKSGDVAFETHAFVDPDDVGNVWRNSVDVAGGEHSLFGAWVHIIHHISPARHWSEMTALRRERAQQYVAEGAVVIQVEAASALRQLMFARRFDVLARHALTSLDAITCAEAGTTPPTRSEAELADLADLLERKSGRGSPSAPGRHRWIDAIAGRLALLVVPRQLLHPS